MPEWPRHGQPHLFLPWDWHRDLGGPVKSVIAPKSNAPRSAYASPLTKGNTQTTMSNMRLQRELILILAVAFVAATAGGLGRGVQTDQCQQPHVP